MRLGTILVVISYALKNVVYAKGMTHSSYVMTLRDSEHEFMNDYDPLYSYEKIGSLNVVGANLTGNALESLLKHENVTNVEINYPITIATKNAPTTVDLSKYNIFASAEDPTIKVQNSAPIQLDRLNDPGLDGKYYYKEDGTGVTIVTFDTGINPEHRDFAPNTRISSKYSFSAYGDTNDLEGHGTATASNAAGMICGAAKSAEIVPFKILDNQGNGVMIDVLNGIKALIQKSTTVFKGNKIVALFSLSSPVSQILKDVMSQLTDAGIVVVVASGNYGHDSCTNGFAFASTGNPAILSVGALSSSDDSMAYFSNYGSCTQVFVKGDNILCANNLDTQGYVEMSGTSMSAAIVAGMIATLWEKYSLLDNQGIVAQFLAIAEKNTPTFDLMNGYPIPFVIGALNPLSIPDDLRVYQADGRSLNSDFQDWPQFLQLTEPVKSGRQYVLNMSVSTSDSNAVFTVGLSTIADSQLHDKYTAGFNSNVPVVWEKLTLTSTAMYNQYNQGNANSYPYKFSTTIEGVYSLNLTAGTDNVIVSVSKDGAQLGKFEIPFYAYRFFSLSAVSPFNVDFQKITLLDLPGELYPENSPIVLKGKNAVSWGEVVFPAKNGNVCFSFQPNGLGTLYLMFNGGEYNATINSSKAKKYSLCLLSGKEKTCITSSKPFITPKSSNTMVVMVTSNSLYLSSGAKSLKVVADSSTVLDGEVSVAFGSKNMKISKLAPC